MHRKQQDITTMVLSWGSIKWFVSPDTVSGATSSFGEVVINPTKGHDRHEHPDADEVLYVIEGTGRQTVGDGPEFDIAAGDAIWVPRGTLHSTFNTGWRPLRLIATYTPGGEEQSLRTLPDFVELPAGENPVWHQRK
jgi:mannose-6-phosphate isomerase-like protein (cupin superfamily)